MPKSRTSQPAPKVRLIASDDEHPTIEVRPGMRFEVTATTIVDAKLKPVGKVAARLCGGTDTCLALTVID